VAGPQFAIADADFLHSFDGFIERAVTKAVALRAQHYAVYGGIDFAKCGRNRCGDSHLQDFSSGQHGSSLQELT
jgi:hypothetical protein